MPINIDFYIERRGKKDYSFTALLDKMFRCLKASLYVIDQHLARLPHIGYVTIEKDKWCSVFETFGQMGIVMCLHRNGYQDAIDSACHQVPQDFPLSVYFLQRLADNNVVAGLIGHFFDTRNGRGKEMP